VKRCGKSAPLRQQWRWHGKPHTEQDQIGEDGPSGPACWLGAPQLPGRSLELRSNVRPRGMVAVPLLFFERLGAPSFPFVWERVGSKPSGKRSGIQNSAYRPGSYLELKTGAQAPVLLLGTIHRSTADPSASDGIDLSVLAQDARLLKSVWPRPR